MERKTLTLKRPMIEKKSESTKPVIPHRRKQVVVNTQCKPNKHAKTAPTQSLKKESPRQRKNRKRLLSQ